MSDFCHDLPSRGLRLGAAVARPRLGHQDSRRVLQLGGMPGHFLGRLPGTILYLSFIKRNVFGTRSAKKKSNPVLLLDIFLT